MPSTPFCRKSGPLEFTWDYCPTCDTMYVRCPMCGNNCCNASFGWLYPDGTVADHGAEGAAKCDVCNLAYEFQHLAWKHKDYPEVSAEEKTAKQRESDKWWKDTFGSVTDQGSDSV